MFLVFLRPLLFIVAVLVVAYIVRKKVRKVEITEERREKLEEAYIKIEETLQEAKKMPQINTKKLEEARSKINELLKESKKGEIK